MLLYLISKHGELSLLRLDNGLLSLRLTSVFSFPLSLEGWEFLLRLILSLNGVCPVTCKCGGRLLRRLGKGRRLLRCRCFLLGQRRRCFPYGCLFCLFLRLGGGILRFLLRGCRSSILCLFLGSGGGGNLYLFLRCRGAYLSHVLVFNLICHH